MSDFSQQMWRTVLERLGLIFTTHHFKNVQGSLCLSEPQGAGSAHAAPRDHPKCLARVSAPLRLPFNQWGEKLIIKAPAMSFSWPIKRGILEILFQFGHILNRIIICPNFKSFA